MAWPPKSEQNFMECSHCSSVWFEEVLVAQFPKDQSVALAQPITPDPSRPPFRLLRCSICTALKEPKINRNPRDYLNSLYDEFLDAFVAHRKKKEEKQQDIEIAEL